MTIAFGRLLPGNFRNFGETMEDGRNCALLDSKGVVIGLMGVQMRSTGLQLTRCGSTGTLQSWQTRSIEIHENEANMMKISIERVCSRFAMDN